MVRGRGGKEQNQKLHCPFLANVYPYVQITKNTYLENKANQNRCLLGDEISKILASFIRSRVIYLA